MSAVAETDMTYEPGNGWDKYQMLVLAELKRLADQGEKRDLLIQEHTLQFARVTLQNTQRDEALSDLLHEVKNLRSAVSLVQQGQDSHKAEKKTFSKVGRWTAVGAAWAATTAVAVYSAVTPHHEIILHSVPK